MLYSATVAIAAAADNLTLAPGPREVGAKPTRSRHCKRGAARLAYVTESP